MTARTELEAQDILQPLRLTAAMLPPSRADRDYRAATASYTQLQTQTMPPLRTTTSPTLSQADEVVITVIGCDAPSDRTVSSSNTTMIATATNGSTYLPFGVSEARRLGNHGGHTVVHH